MDEEKFRNTLIKCCYCK